MKKKQIALLLAALMCITPVTETAAVMGAEFSSGEETVEIQNTEEKAESIAMKTLKRNLQKQQRHQWK